MTGGTASPAAAQLDRSAHLSQRNFSRLAAYVEDACGIRLPPAKKTMVEGRLRRRVRALGLGGLDAYCDRFFDHALPPGEATSLINAITTNKTEFFREPDHFTYLAETALPDLAEQGAGLRRPLKLWSAASSIGAEPYSIAMVVDRFAQSHRGCRTQILATDISTDVLDKARLAIYPEEMAAPIPMEFRRRYLMRSKDASKGLVRVVPELRRQVGFARLNLMDETYPVDQDFDVIFCRNILIYFDKPRQQAVLHHLCRHLRPGGFLFVGHTETVAGFDLPVRQAATAVFRRC